MREGVAEHDVDEVMLMQGFASSEAMFLRDAIEQMCWTSARVERLGVLSGVFSSLLKSLQKIVEGGFQARLKSGELRNCFMLTLSYCCDTPEAKNMPAV